MSGPRMNDRSSDVAAAPAALNVMYVNTFRNE
jgi:hypothetical protein